MARGGYRHYLNRLFEKGEITEAQGHRMLAEWNQRQIRMGRHVAHSARRMWGGGGGGRRWGPSKSQVERSIGRGEKRDERRDKVTAERFARTKDPFDAFWHEKKQLTEKYGKKADPLIEQLKKGYDVATKIKDKREARRDKRLGDAHARMAKEDARVVRKPWAEGRFQGIDYPGWRIKERGWRGAERPETKEEYVYRLGQRGTTDEGYSVHIPHRLHEKDIAEPGKKSPQEKYLDYHGRRMAKEEFAWRKRTARARLIADARRRRLRERDNWYV